VSTSGENQRASSWIAQGAVLVHRDGARIIGTVVVLDHDPGTWDIDETPAVYVHLLMVDRSRAGEHLGARILEQVEEMARARGACFVRLDVGSDLGKLQRWYADRGFKVVTKRSLDDGGNTFDVTLRQKPLAP
jgi:GNAT superfamily N-acetyltransferase